ncbi:MAG: hypothetical protein A2W05_08500 [Candidatus Schekmanbacteria bacterium RBG_16_38_10]|uniref:Peptidase S54 rhomboid domain-containing protein n=1 Tax=Candidatus Schekmanbacteria bacterium RBG_16_38_10 TaxID=1817879 RepID=A0A1F7RPW3_9BACT|nr:MAG: hypothetical protein A2W05_08500 [Candidatus Schekmanbacteria bacterium RBG_16_38_10]
MSYYYRSGPSFSFGYPVTPVIKKLIIANVAVFLLQFLSSYKIIYLFGLVPYMVIREFYFWQLFTYQFLHGGLFHILFNMLALWMFGGDLERIWGAASFLKYYFLCAVGAGVCTVIFLPTSMSPTIGASGAIYGILMAYGMLFPDRMVYLYFMFPIKVKHFVILMGAIALFSSMSASESGVAHIAHLGGMIFGYLYLKNWDIKGIFRQAYLKLKYKRLKRKLRVISKDDDHNNDKPYYH